MGDQSANGRDSGSPWRRSAGAFGARREIVARALATFDLCGEPRAGEADSRGGRGERSRPVVEGEDGPTLRSPNMQHDRSRS